MSNGQRKWDKHEAVILLDALLEVLDGKTSRNDAVKRVSSDLRQMARDNGKDIDNVFRNENGISSQMRYMKLAIKGHDTSNDYVPRMFEEVAEIYRSDKQEYERLLKEARSMSKHTKSCESDFTSWLSAKISPAQLSELHWCYSEIEASCMKAKILHKPLFETTDVETIRSVQRFLKQNKLLRVRHLLRFSKIVSASCYYLTYLTEKPPQEADTIEQPKEPITAPTPQQTSPTKTTAHDPSQSTVQNIDAISCKTESSEVAKPDEHASEPEILCVDFDNFRAYTYTKPYRFFYFGESKGSFSSWKNLYVVFFATLEEDYPHLFHSGMAFSSRGQAELTTAADGIKMREPRPVPGTNYIIETHYSAINIIRKMKYMLNLCTVDYENVVIQCIRETDTKSTYVAAATDAGIVAIKEDAKAVIVRPENTQPRTSSVNKDSFYSYLLNVEKLPIAICKSYIFAISSCETFAQEHHYVPWRLYTSDYAQAKAAADALFRDRDFIEYNNRWNNQPMDAIPKLLAFIGDGNAACVTVTKQDHPPVNEAATNSPVKYHNEPYERVLREEFRQGFRLGSNIEIRRLRKSYADIHGEEPTESDAEILDIVKKLCIQYKSKEKVRAYLPDVMLSKELQEKMIAYINECFDSGKSMIYYKALCTKFSGDFLDYPLYNDPNALKAYLEFVNNGQFYINSDGISKTPNAVADPREELRNCLKEFGCPVKLEELFASLSHLPQSRIKYLLTTSDEFISNGQGAYFHESIVQISDEELENIVQIIEQTIAEKNYISGNELYEIIRAKYPYIIENNTELSVNGFRDALRYKLIKLKQNRFFFSRNIISARNRLVSRGVVFADYAKSHDSFTWDELKSIADDLNLSIDLYSVYDNSLRINREQFVSKEQAQFDVPQTDAAIDRFCTGDYIAASQVNNFGGFPYAGFPWNSFLLEHYVAKYSEKYILLHSEFLKTKCCSAIVKRSSGITDFNSFIVRLLTDADVELEKEIVLQFLVDEGYLANRSYTNIERLIARVKAQRNKKGTN